MQALGPRYCYNRLSTGRERFDEAGGPLLWAISLGGGKRVGAFLMILAGVRGVRFLPGNATLHMHFFEASMWGS